MFVFGTLWIGLLTAELTIAYHFLKAQVWHHSSWPAANKRPDPSANLTARCGAR